MTNCRNCGAPIDAASLYKCPYCGTVYSHIHEPKLSGNCREAYKLQTELYASLVTKDLYSEAIKAIRRYGEVRVL